MELKRITLLEAKQFVFKYHRHHPPPIGHKFSLGCFEDDKLVGVAVVSRPVARMLDDGHTLEVTRLATDGTRNACSFLYSACAREAKKMGYSKIITYILESENGASLRASGWTLEKEHCGGLEWKGKRYEKKVEQMSIFNDKKIVPKEYKKRYCKILKKVDKFEKYGG